MAGRLRPMKSGAPPGTAEASPPDAALACADLRKRFGRTTALQGVTVKIPRGMVLAIMGESGSGKSTLLLCLAGVIKPDSGYVWYEGQELTRLRDSDLTRLRRQEFGFVFQMGYLLPDLPALTNVAMPSILAGLSRREAEARAREWLGRLGVLEMADRRPAQLSVGEMQRVAVARALASQPKVIFADEPTGALDSRNAAAVMHELVSAAHQSGTTVILVTHSRQVARYADGALVMSDGAIRPTKVSA